MTSPSQQPLRIGMLAGELSGDILGAGLIKAIKKIHPDVIIEGVGGPRMIALGCRSMADIDQLAMMGYVEPILNLPKLLATRRRLYQHFVDNPPDVFIGIDYAYFNNSLERRLKAAGIKTAHYVSPQLWASRPGRIHKFAKTIDLMLCLFPFEVDIYQQHNIQASFVGHPLADEFPLEPNMLNARKSLNLQETGKVIALLPGSRGNEIKYLLQEFIAAAEFCYQQDKTIQFVLPAANEKRYQQIKTELTDSDLPITLLQGDSHIAMTAADVVLMASGTTTLEAMLLKKPMVVSYKMSALNYGIMSRLLISEHIALPNILAGEKLVPEIIQDQVTGESLGKAVMNYFSKPEKVQQLKDKFLAIHHTLKQGGDQRAAESLLQLIRSNLTK